jgi:adenylosuccinate lyase
MWIDMSFDHSIYVSPLSWRYGSLEMRRIWSEEHKRRLMRRVWVSLAKAQHTAGLITPEQLADLENHQDDIDIERALEIEVETRHDVMAEIRAFAEQCPVGGGVIHWGATSADITDNVDVLRMREAVTVLRRGLGKLLTSLVDRIEATADLVAMGHTHIQPAEPTTLGYRFALYAQDLLEDCLALKALGRDLKGKGFKGAVGSQASFSQMLTGSGVSPSQMEAEAMAHLDLPYYSIASQTYPRKQDLRVQQVLAGIAASLHKYALDFRLLQSPLSGELEEPFGQEQVGSSAMPFKRNPVHSENICSLARYVATSPSVAWSNASQAILERSLDDSANRRLVQAQSFLATDEMITRATMITSGLTIDVAMIERNLDRHAPFAATERVLTALVAAGADRQLSHDWIRESSMVAWTAVRQGKENPLSELLAADERVRRFLDVETVGRLMEAKSYAGTAAERAIAFARKLRQKIGVS